MPLKVKASPDSRLKRRIEAQTQTIEQQRETIQAQQAELDGLREAYRDATAEKPGRAFRKRKLFHGALDIAISGSDVTEDEVHIEHVGESLLILVGDAAILARGDAQAGVRREPRYGTADVARAIAATPQSSTTVENFNGQYPAPPQSGSTYQPPPLDPHTAADLALAKTLQPEAFDVFGLSAPQYTDSGQLVTNAALVPQGDPRRPGSVQDRSNAAAGAAYGGYNGLGPAPAGWVDPDKPASAEKPPN